MNAGAKAANKKSGIECRSRTDNFFQKAFMTSELTMPKRIAGTIIAKTMMPSGETIRKPLSVMFAR